MARYDSPRDWTGQDPGTPAPGTPASDGRPLAGLSMLDPVPQRGRRILSGVEAHPAARLLNALAGGYGAGHGADDGADHPAHPSGGPEALLQLGDGGDAGLALAEQAEGPRGATVSLADLARVLPCFTADCPLLTDRGWRAAGTLRPGDRLQTRDAGMQPILWAGRREFGWQATALLPELRPVHIAAGALGPALPGVDGWSGRMAVSGNHLVLTGGPGGESLTPARSLTDHPGVARAEAGRLAYVHLLLDGHHLVAAGGHWSESLGPDPLGYACLGSGPDGAAPAATATALCRPLAGA
ncbi:Hint domain-containing protein [Frigidibacter sp. MR17.24]|uniref:Hint domain-containing protein n=1 Tax=Frigidibacter sp. MR17.24 TaxID=3127345 RepID=UPI003012A050